jgi:glycerate 2-kinase
LFSSISLSDLKGGKLAELAYPAQVIALILSDIIDDPIDLVKKLSTKSDRSDKSNYLENLIIWQIT